MSFVTEWGQEKPVSSHTRVEPPVNDPALFRLVNVRVAKPFRVAGKPLAVGDEVMLEFHLVRDLIALGKCEMIEAQER